MAGLKIAFLIIGAFVLATQVESKANDDDSGLELVVAINRFIADEINVVVHGVLTVALTVDEINNDFDGSLNSIVATTKKVATGIVDKYNEFFAEVSKQASTDAQKLIGCVISKDSVAADIPANFVKSVATCAKDAISNIVSDSAPLSKDLHSTAIKVITSVQDLLSCGGTNQVIAACQYYNLTNIFVIVFEAIPNLVAEALPVISDLPEFRNTVASCRKTSVPDVLNQLETVITSIDSCYKN